MKTAKRIDSRARVGGLALAGIALGLALALSAPSPAHAEGAELAAAGVGAGALQAQADDFSKWYGDGSAATYTIANVGELKYFAELVNTGKDSFEGKEVRLKEGTQFTFDGEVIIDPIGTPEHPFQGTFDGRRGSAEGKGIVAQASETAIRNLTLNVGDRLSYIGLFGYAGDKATIKNVTLTGGKSVLSVSNEAAGKTISNVGALAGYCGGSIENCYSSVEIDIANNGAVPTKEGKTAEELCTITYIGGLVGHLGGDMTDCTHADAELRITSKSNVSDNVPYIAGFVGGLVGLQGDEDDASHVTKAEGCKNSGPLLFTVGGRGGIDRFNMPMYSKSTMVGGIAGYSMGNLRDCENSAEIDTSGIKYEENEYSKSGSLLHAKGDFVSGYGASTVGGIVGSLRGPTIADSTAATGVVGSTTSDPGYSVWVQSDGTTQAKTISVERCENTARLTGLASVGGMCGSTGAFTTVIGCTNKGQINGTRWNKPCPAGIVGISNGDIIYCSNTGRIETTDGGGFYASGITGLLTTYNSATTKANLVLEAPEIYGCYVTGNIVSSSAGYRAAVMAGENDGYIHDNCFLPDLTLDKAIDEEVFGDKEYHSQLVSPGENRGTLSRNHELSAADLRSSAGISLLNYVTGSNGAWDYYYVSNSDPNGFPLLNWEAPDRSGLASQLSNVVKPDGVALVSNPKYSASVDPVPEVSLTTANGTKLYQNSDYRVVPQEGARAVSSGGAYEATIVGMNSYSGTLDQTVKYDIEKCDIGECKILAGSQVFNWKPQDPAWVKVVDGAGNAVSEVDYDWEKVDFDPNNVKADSAGKYHDYTNVHSASYKYDIRVVAKDSSQSYTGSTVQPAFHIEWALLVYESADADSTKQGANYDKVRWGSQTWDYAEALATKGYVKIKYTGSPVTPTVDHASYLGTPLRDGTGKAYYMDPLAYDYRYVYGNANAVEEAAEGKDCINVTGSEPESLACMTIRYISGGNFTNYSNVFFEIVPASIADDVRISGINASYAYTGAAITPVPKLEYNGMMLEEGVDYELKYANNLKQGKASVSITGKGNYSGTATRYFDIGTQPAKRSQTIKALNKSVKLKAKTLKKKKQTINVARVCKVSAKTTVTYSGKANKRAASFKVSKKGTVTVKKGVPKGTYKVRITAKAAASKVYSAAKAKKFTLTVKVR